LCFRKKNDENLFFIVYAAMALLFASVSGYYSPVLFPVASILASLGLSTTLKTFLKNQEAPVRKSIGPSKVISKEINVAVLAGMTAIIGFFLVYSFGAAMHPSVYQPVAKGSHEDRLANDLREAASWLRYNTPEDARVASWRGLGEQLARLSRVSVLAADPHNRTVAYEIAKAFQSEEGNAHQILSNLDVDYVLILFGGRIGYWFDDLNRRHEIAPDSNLSEDSLVFKLSYKGFSETFGHPSQPPIDAVRQQPVLSRPTLTHFQEVFTSQLWLVRIFKLTEAQE